MSTRRASASFPLLMKGNPVGKATFVGKTYKQAESLGRRALRSLGVRQHTKNVAAGFVDAGGTFHPIRASYDYDSMRTGEAGRKRVYGTKRPITKKMARTARKRKGKKRNPKKLNFGERMKKLRAKKARARRR